MYITPHNGVDREINSIQFSKNDMKWFPTCPRVSLYQDVVFAHEHLDKINTVDNRQ